MLLALSIENLAIIESLHVDLSSGLNVLSGETGAGKSIVFAALGLALGGRGSVDMVRTGARAAEVVARFAVGEGPARALLQAEGLADGDAVVIHRSVPARGSGRATVNGQVVKLSLLRQLGALLVDFAAQHAHQELLDPARHLDILDDFAELAGPLARMGAAFERWTERRRELTRLQDAARHVDERAEYLRFQRGELDELDLSPGEEAELEAERRIQRHAVELGAGVKRTYGLLYAKDGAATELLDQAQDTLQRMGAIDPALAPLAERLAALVVEVEDVAAELRGREVEHDPVRLDEIESRLARIDRLKRKHRCDADALVERRAALAAELDELDQLDDRIALAADAAERAWTEALAVARDLRRERIKAAAALETQVTAQLRDLAMPHAQLRVALSPLDEGPAGPDGTRLDARGLDHAELHLSANCGEAPRPLARVASGGELSRVLLALRAALHTGSGPRTQVFDEVDAGISGHAAHDVGRKLVALARHRQVLCITHLPQIACLADAHFAAAKRVVDGRTVAGLSALDAEGRVAEIARLVGGGADAASVDYARRLLGEVSGARLRVA
ncbi:MAG: DNA repair protein RecN [Alphaproteobacteria bacterium]|nr:DNA repair protein RecN [Alphaproteobacteria bacterium]